MEKALDNQVGGLHYKTMEMQPIELITALKCSFIQGNIIKYISRYKYKNGKQDIEKCIHYAQLAIELKDKKVCGSQKISVNINRFILKNKLSLLQRKVISAAISNQYHNVILYCKDIIDKEYANLG